MLLGPDARLGTVAAHVVLVGGLARLRRSLPARAPCLARRAAVVAVGADHGRARRHRPAYAAATAAHRPLGRHPDGRPGRCRRRLGPGGRGGVPAFGGGRVPPARVPTAPATRPAAPARAAVRIRRRRQAPGRRRQPAACSTAARRPRRSPSCSTPTPASTRGSRRRSAPTRPSGYQLATDEPVMAIGGFNGTDPTPTLAQFEQYVRAGQDPLLHRRGGFGGFGGGGSGGSVPTASTSRHPVVGREPLHRQRRSAASRSTTSPRPVPDPVAPRCPVMPLAPRDWVQEPGRLRQPSIRWPAIDMFVGNTGASSGVNQAASAISLPSTVISPRAIAGTEADHQLVRERPRLAPPEVDVADLEARPPRAPPGAPRSRASRPAPRIPRGTRRSPRGNSRVPGQERRGRRRARPA